MPEEPPGPAEVAIDPIAAASLVAPPEPERFRVPVLASFDAQLLARPLAAWLAEAGMPWVVTCSPPAPLPLALLQTASMCRASQTAAHVLLAQQHELADAQGTALVQALSDHARVCAAPVVLGLMPPLDGEARSTTTSDSAPFAIPPALADLLRVPVVLPDTLCRGLDAAPHDPWLAERTGIPFTSAFFQHAAPALARALHAASHAPAKVLVLDGDGTLWDGVAGEDGPEHVQVSTRARAVHAFAHTQRANGVLLALVSKNIEADVRSVFEHIEARHLLTWQDFAAVRVNWLTKAENLASLSTQLRLPLESFVLLDDSGIECAAVRAAHPQMVCLEAPSTATATENLLRECWMFDGARATNESARRSALYEADSDREAARTTALDQRAFLDALGLQITIAAATPEDVPRMAELSIRTNQFNLGRSRESEAQIRQALASGGSRFVVRVTDRFGDYGLVGVLGWQEIDDTLEISRLLLSCRALGRGVEHAMLRYAAAHATSCGLTTLRLAYSPAPRSEPARRFLDALPETTRAESGDRVVYELPATAALHVTLADTAEPVASGTPISDTQAVTPAPPSAAVARARGLERIATGTTRLGASSGVSTADPPSRVRKEQNSTCSPLEAEIAAIWCDVLGRSDVDPDQRFADLGGSSLQLVDVFAALAERGHRELAFVDLFRHNSVRSLAAFLSRSSKAMADHHATSARTPYAPGSPQDPAYISGDLADRKGPPHVSPGPPHLPPSPPPVTPGAPHKLPGSPHLLPSPPYVSDGSSNVGHGLRQREAFVATAKRAREARR